MVFFYRLFSKNMVAKKKMNTFVAEKFGASKKKCELCSRFSGNDLCEAAFPTTWKDARVAEEARLESV